MGTHRAPSSSVPLKRQGTCLYLIFLTFFVYGQQDTIVVHERILDETLRQRLENQLDELEEEADYSTYREELELLLTHPVNLNTASAEELQKLFFLNDFQISRLQQHIRQTGPLISIYELQAIEGFDLQTIRLMLPFVTVSGGNRNCLPPLEEMFRHGKGQLFIRFQQLIERQNTFISSEADHIPATERTYPGSPARIYTRYRFTWYQNISFGITAEKDPGEEFFRGSQKRGFDYYSAHLFLRPGNKLRILALGDYHLQFGQGLVLWSSPGFGKGSDPVHVNKNAAGLKPHTSAEENRFMRGAAAAFSLGNFEVTGCFSHRTLDANILESDSLSGKVLAFSSFQHSGLHRTANEIKNRKAVSQTLAGGNITWRRSHFQAGLTACHLQFGAEYRRSPSLYNGFDFSNKSNQNIGVNYHYILRNFHFFGEAAISQSRGRAVLTGLMASLHRGLSVSFLYRDFQPHYHALYAEPFSENAGARNEKGIFSGIQLQISSRLWLMAHADHFTFPWMNYRTHMPSAGYDYLVQLHYKPLPQTEMYFRYRLKNKPMNTREESPVRFLDDVIRQSYRLHLSYPLTETISMRSRVEWLDHQFGLKHETGFMICQDILFRSMDSPWSLTFRYALFDTAGYDSRIYVYENDVLYAFSFPFYSGKGTRMYLLARYRFSRKIDLYARLARTDKPHPKSGWQIVSQSPPTELKVQARLTF